MAVPVRVTFDRLANAAYIYLREIEPGGVAQTVPVDESPLPGTINLDFGAKGRLSGIEVLGATGALPQEILDRAERI
jgi:uncharacterized protein YuzE